MIEGQDWTEAYKEMCDMITPPEDPTLGIPEVKHKDLYHGQVEHAEEDYPWPSDSVFFKFNAVAIETIGGGVQAITMTVDIIYALDLIADSYDGSPVQDVALSFMKVCKKLHHLFQGASGENFSSMDRTGFNMLPSHPSLMVLSQRYQTIIMDYTGKKVRKEATVTGVKVEKGTAPVPEEEDEKGFDIQL